ncbi:hypothetical protein GOV11_02485 [Candidatus Woesearchaeota archaeon]|nr:hypothetical protein [Candidatus Woesearchaeota archaeon]
MKPNYIIPMIIALLLLASCAPQSRDPRVSPFIGGNIALNLYLQEGMPPPAVYDGGNFPFGLNIVAENVGEADVGPGTDNPYMTAKIEGINPSTFGTSDSAMHATLQESLLGSQKNFDGTIIGGLVTSFIFDGLNYQGKLRGSDIFTLRGTTCYDYQNWATTQLCFKADIIENVQDSTICTLTGAREFVHNSGGPIHITSVNQNPLNSGKIQANFQLQHVGPGEFFGREPGEDCDPSFRNTNKYKIEVDVKMEDPSAIVQCGRLGNSNRGVITLYAGSPQTVTCTITGSSTSTRVYTDVMTVQTTYRYGQFIEQPLIVQSVPSE